MERTAWYSINEQQLQCILGTGEPVTSINLRRNSFNNYLHLIKKFYIPDEKGLTIYKDTGIFLTRTAPITEPAAMVLKNTFNALSFDLDNSSRKIHFNLLSSLYVKRIREVDSCLNTLNLFDIPLTEYGHEFIEYLDFVWRVTNKWNCANELEFGSHNAQLERIFNICYLIKKYNGKDLRSKIRETIVGCGPKLGAYIRDFVQDQKDVKEEFKDYFIKEYIIEFA